jgi:4'-phosphopantetheinyl transferase
MTGADADSGGNLAGSPSLDLWRPSLSSTALGPHEVSTWLVELDHGLEPEDVETAEPGPELDVLADDERVRAARFVRARDRRRFARCRAALREILGAILGASPGSLRFKAAAKGKPELDRSPAGCGLPEAVPLRFNVSHSSNLALIAVCWGRELGVDLELVRPITEAERIVASFFTPAEATEFAAIPPEIKVRAFLRGWTRKEAFLKGLGIGIAGIAADHQTGFGMTELSAWFTPAEPVAQVSEWQMWEAAPRPEFVAALAVRRVDQA